MPHASTKGSTIFQRPQKMVGASSIQTASMRSGKCCTARWAGAGGILVDMHGKGHCTGQAQAPWPCVGAAAMTVQDSAGMRPPPPLPVAPVPAW